MQVAPYGTWRSPLTPDTIVADSVRLGEVALTDNAVYWVEGRPTEGGRQVLVRLRDGHKDDLTPEPFSVRTRAHEYGGGALSVDGERIWFSNDGDQRIYEVTAEGPVAVTPDGPFCYADAVYDAHRGRLICVRETHQEGSSEPVNDIVAIDLGSGAVNVLAHGHDFFTSPRLSPDGTRLAFVTWDHPNMPWDGTDLWTAVFNDDGTLGTLLHLAGGQDEAVVHPQFAEDGALYFVSDRSGWWNLYRVRPDHGGLLEASPVECVLERDRDFGKPHWIFGMRTYGFVDARTAICSWAEEGEWRLGRLDLENGELSELPLPFTEYESLCVAGDRAACIAGAKDATSAVTEIDLSSSRATVLRESAQFLFERDYLSQPESIRFESGGFDVHAFFYPPASATYRADGDERPPLIVIGHGGPTSSTSAVLNTRIQYWTSRGFAVVDVNYRGSTGFGRDYRRALNRAWGIADVEDCVNAARYLADTGRVDPHRLVIRGGSAGGFTALAALVFHDTFKAGASYYGISELEALATDTHKFESRYLDSLIGAYPEERETYQARSPIHFTHQLDCPVIFFQGLEDKVVPPNQAEMMVEALRDKGLPVAYLPFEGEQHGFRRAGTIKRTLEAELYFYGKVFGFEPAGDIPPVEIDNL